MRVTPHVGVWIEILMTQELLPGARVTPHVGVWIEMTLRLGGI